MLLRNILRAIIGFRISALHVKIALEGHAAAAAPRFRQVHLQPRQPELTPQPFHRERVESARQRPQTGESCLSMRSEQRAPGHPEVNSPLLPFSGVAAQKCGVPSHLLGRAPQIASRLCGAGVMRRQTVTLRRCCVRDCSFPP